MKKLSIEQMEVSVGGEPGLDAFYMWLMICDGLWYAISNNTLSTFDHVQAVNLYQALNC